jgi:hypothetical protein
VLSVSDGVATVDLRPGPMTNYSWLGVLSLRRFCWIACWVWTSLQTRRKLPLRAAMRRSGWSEACVKLVEPS